MNEILIYKDANRKLFNDFVESLDSKFENYIPEIPKDTEYNTVLFELRPMKIIKNIIKNHLYFLNKNKSNIKWGLQIFCGLDNEGFIRQELKDWENVVYNNIGIKNIKDRTEHTAILKTLDFWESLNGSKILLFQTDSLILREGIDEFLGYDYVGAPWSKPKENVYVGNGGLSLRTKTKMIEIIKKYPNDTTTLEDIYFSKHMKDENIVDIETAKRFCVEDVYFDNPMGIHKTDKIETELLKKLLEKNVLNYSL